MERHFFAVTDEMVLAGRRLWSRKKKSQRRSVMSHRSNRRNPQSKPDVRAPSAANLGNRLRDQPARFLTIPDVGRYIGVSARTIRRWIAAGDLVVHRFGNSV